MDLRRQATPFGLALGASLALHAAFLANLPGAAPRRRAPSQDVVVVELRDPGPEAQPQQSEGPLPGQPVEAAAAETERDPEGAQRAEPTGPREQADRTEPAPAEPRASHPPRGPTEASAAATADGPPKAPATPTAPALRLVPGAQTVLEAPAPPQFVRPRSPDLRDLLPRAGDLAAYGRSKALPDPTAPGARETVVVGLGEQDPRYRGYLEQVQAAIYGAWRTGRALLVAGPSRTCLVRFSLTPLGLPGDVQVVRRSGNPTLDADAVDAVRRARIPPFPTHWTLERLQMEAQFDYVLP